MGEKDLLNIKQAGLTIPSNLSKFIDSFNRWPNDILSEPVLIASWENSNNKQYIKGMRSHVRSLHGPNDVTMLINSYLQWSHLEKETYSNHISSFRQITMEKQETTRPLLIPLHFWHLCLPTLSSNDGAIGHVVHRPLCHRLSRHVFQPKPLIFIGRARSWKGLVDSSLHMPWN